VCRISWNDAIALTADNSVGGPEAHAATPSWVQTDAAKTLLEQLSTRFTNFTIEGFIHSYRATNPVALDAVRVGAIKAELPFRVDA